jgi:hypothetical protein
LSICIHVGLPKCASTTLQMDLFSKHSDFNYLGRCFQSTRGLYKDKRLDAFYEELKLGNEIDGELARAVESLLDHQKVNLFSHEGMTELSLSSYKTTARRLKDCFPEAKILFLIRNQASLLRSYYEMKRPYKVLFPMGKPKAEISFAHWVDYCLTHQPETFSVLHYDEVYGTYSSLFGNENVLLLLMEDLLKKPRTVANQIAKYFSVDLEEAIALLEAPRKHHSAPTGRKVLYRKFVEPLVLKSKLSRIAPLKFRASVKAFLNQGTTTYLQLPEDTKRAVESEFSVSNRRLGDFGVSLESLEAYKYPMLG